MKKKDFLYHRRCSVSAVLRGKKFKNFKESWKYSFKERNWQEHVIKDKQNKKYICVNTSIHIFGDKCYSTSSLTYIYDCPFFFSSFWCSFSYKCSSLDLFLSFRLQIFSIHFLVFRSLSFFSLLFFFFFKDIKPFYFLFRIKRTE